MNKARFPLFASGLGGFLLMVLITADGAHGGSLFTLPLLTLLIISEFGFILTAAGAWLGWQQQANTASRPGMLAVTAACALLAMAFAILGIGYWPL